jgi:predicted MPP superfamily phosphohydrolase
MITLDYRPFRKTFNLYLLGDIHEGRIGVNHDRLKEAVAIIKSDKKGYAALMGDMCESISVGDNRYNPYECEGRYKRTTEQIAALTEYLYPIRKQIISILMGNHEEKLDFTLNVSSELAKLLGRADLKTGSRTNVLYLTDNIRVYLTHGSGSATSRAGDPEQIELCESISIKRKLRRLRADCILMAMGHVHKLRICKPVRGLRIVGGKQCYPTSFIDPQTGAIEENYRYYCSTGSFVTGYAEGVDTYVERAMYSPTEIGFIKATVVKDQMVDIEKIIL